MFARDFVKYFTSGQSVISKCRIFASRKAHRAWKRRASFRNPRRARNNKTGFSSLAEKRPGAQRGQRATFNINTGMETRSDFLNLPGLDRRVISYDVEGMQHHISPPKLRAFETLAEQFGRQPALVERVRLAGKV